MKTHLSLFSGIGGLDIAAEWAGFQTAGQCEWADYPTKVLEKHWPDVPRWRDIRTLTGEDFYERTGLRTVDVISGGFPCQPFSVAGKRRGAEDDRFLWPEMLRVIREIRPTWVIGENVAGIVTMALDQVLSDLEAEGYETQAFVFPACGVDAPHRRDRVCIVAYSNRDSGGSRRLEPAGQQRQAGVADGGNSMENANGCGNSEDVANAESKQDNIGREPTEDGNRAPHRQQRENVVAEPCGCGEDVADANNKGLQGRERGELQECTRQRTIGPRCPLCNTASEGLQNGADIEMGRCKPFQESQRSDWWTVEPDVGRVAHGVPHRVDRLKCLGNAVVPQQFYPVFKAIADIMEANHDL